MNERADITTSAAPEAVGPYSQAIKANGFLFCSGQLPLDPESGEIVGATPAEQADRCLENLRTVCEAAGTRLDAAVKITVYTTDLGEFAAVNEVYAGFFSETSPSPPARAAVEVSGLPRGVQVEIDAVVPIGE